MQTHLKQLNVLILKSQIKNQRNLKVAKYLLELMYCVIVSDISFILNGFDNAEIMCLLSNINLLKLHCIKEFCYNGYNIPVPLPEF